MMGAVNVLFAMSGSRQTLSIIVSTSSTFLMRASPGKVALYSLSLRCVCAREGEVCVLQGFTL
jgi:hypothetical protein